MNETLTYLLLWQVIAHVLCDFFFQTDASCKEKLEYGFRAKGLYIHALIAGVLSFVFAFDWHFWLFSLGIASIHLVIDGWKAISRPFGSKFFVDQVLHLGVLLGASWLYLEMNTYDSWLPITLSVSQVFFVLAVLLCLKPANIIIREVMKAQGLITDESSEGVSDSNDEKVQKELENAGRLIGILERLLTFSFVMSGHFTAIGFIVAAKSILRYRDGATAKTEYVLVGTLLSIGIALVLGLVYNGMVSR